MRTGHVAADPVLLEDVALLISPSMRLSFGLHCYQMVWSAERDF
jgi:hypothetical protein